MFSATPDLIRSAGLGRDVARALGGARAVLLAHHGVVFGGGSVAEAVLTGLWLELLCRSSLLLGGTATAVAVDVLAEKAARTFADSAVRQHWSYLRRTLPPRPGP